MSRSMKINNPSNLRQCPVRYVGEIRPSSDREFKQFDTLIHGLRACMSNIIHKMNSGANTVHKLISIWAPPKENKTDVYVKFICSKTGFAPNDVLPRNRYVVIVLCKFICQFECGLICNQEDISSAFDLLIFEK